LSSHSTDGFLLGIDLGTTCTKAGIFNYEGKLIGLGQSSSYDVYSPAPGWSESDPDALWEALIASIHDAYAKANIQGSDIQAVGLTTIFPAVIPLDQYANPMYPAILYSDQRSMRQVAAIYEKISQEKYQRITGNILVPGNCAVTSMAWLRDERPDIYTSAMILGFANTYVTSKLTGEFYTDTTNAAVSGLVDIHKPWEWSEQLCEICSIDIDRLPEITQPHEIIGSISRAASDTTGLKIGTPVMCGCGDAVASPFGAGALREGSILYTAGTTDCVTVPLSKPTGDTRLVNTAFVSDKSWCAIGTSTSSGASIEWFKREFLQRRCAQTEQDVYQFMADIAESCRPGCNGLLYIPYLQGERTPIWDPLARGMFIGLKTSTSTCELARSVFEGTAYALRDVIECVESAMSTQVKEIRTVGGCTKSDLWNQIKADVLNRPIDVLQYQETGSLGAALLAGTGSGIYKSREEANEVVRKLIDVKRVNPDPKQKDIYDKLFSIFKGVYPNIKESLHQLVNEIENEVY
jgi:xylulokinase